MSEDAGDREEQLAYSEIMAKMLDEEARRKKAAKIVAVVRHALGVETLDGLRAVDVGCSAGFIADELALAGATTSGVDIDEPGLEKARGPLRRAGRLPARPRRGPALRRRLRRRRRAQPHLRARRRPRGRRRRHPPGPAPGRRALPRHRPPLAGASSRTTGCRSCRGCRAAPPTATSGSPARVSTTTSATTPPPACGGSSRPSTSGTTPCPCSPTRGPSPPTTTSRPGRRGCHRPPSAPRSRSCPPTSGRRSRARPRRPVRRCAVPPRHLAS